MTYGFGKTSFVAPAVDAFGRLRTADPETQFEGKFTYGNEEKLFNTTLATGGTATFAPNTASWNLATTTSSGSSVLRESWRYFHYHAGKSQEIILTGVFGTAEANCTKRIGYYDNNDGLFFVQNGTTGFGVCRRTSTSGSPVDNIVYQADWNLDKLDGTGPSGITFDPTKTNIFLIDFQWLGVGAVRFGLDIDGVLIYVHQINNANVLTDVYMKSAWLPVRYEMVNTGATTNPGALKQICSTVMSEGGIESIGTLYSTLDLTTTNVTTGAWLPILTLRVDTTVNSQQFRGLIKLNSISALCSGANESAFAIFESPTLTGASFVAVGGASACSVDTTATALSGGIIRGSILLPKTTGSAQVELAEDFVAVAGMTYTIAGRGVGGNSTITATMNWREIV